MWMINVFLRVLCINVWLIVLAILILKIPALNTTYNIIMLIVLTVYYGTIFSFYALTLNYSVYQQKIDSKFLEQTRTALYFMPVLIVLYTFNFQGVQLNNQQDLTFKSVSGTLLNVYQTPHLISELKCLQDDCLGKRTFCPLTLAISLLSKTPLHSGFIALSMGLAYAFMPQAS